MAKRWYVVHAYSGFEKNVARALKERIGLSKLEEYFGEVLVPTEEVVEMRAGQKRRSERKFFPGYVLVEMELNDETWHLVKETPRVMGFIGGKAIGRRRLPKKKRRRSSIASSRAARRRRRRRSTNRANWCASSMDRSTISTASSSSVNYEKSRLVVARDDIRSLDAGRTRLRAGREGLSCRALARQRDEMTAAQRCGHGECDSQRRRTLEPIQGEIDGKESPGLHQAAGDGG